MSRIHSFIGFMVFLTVSLGLTFIMAGCTTVPTQTSILQERQQQIIACVKDLKQSDFESLESFEICRQTYRLKKLKE